MNNGENFGSAPQPTMPEIGSDEWISMKQNEMAAHAAKLAEAERNTRTNEVRQEPEVRIDIPHVEPVWGDEDYVLNNSAVPEEQKNAEEAKNEEIRQEAIANTGVVEEIKDVAQGEKEIAMTKEEWIQLKEEFNELKKQNEELLAKMKQQEETGTEILGILSNAYKEGLQSDVAVPVINVDDYESFDDSDIDIEPSRAARNSEESGEKIQEIREKLKQAKSRVGAFGKRVVAVAALVATLVSVGAPLAEKVIAEDSAQIRSEQSIDKYNLEYNEVGIGYNYDGLFGGGDGYGYNSQKAGKYQFASGDVLGDVWKDEQGTRDKLVELVHRQPDLNGADYLCQLSEKDLAKIEMTENGTDLATISEWMGSDKEFSDEAIQLLESLIQDDKDTKISFGRLTDFSKAGTYYNALGKIKTEDKENNTENVGIVACETYEDENTAVIAMDTGNSVLLIKAGHFDSDGNYIADGCAQVISLKPGVFTNVEKVEDVKPDHHDKEKDTGNNEEENPEDGEGGDEPFNPTPAPIPEESEPEEPTPEKEWGKSGDTHAGDFEFNKDLVNPASEVTREQSEHANDGNRGYSNRNNNIVDRAGNEAQRTAPGRDSGGNVIDHSDAEEEAAIASGNF